MVMDKAAEEEASHLIPGPFRTTTGVTKDMTSFEPVDFFLELFPKELLVKQTNRYG